MISRSNRAPRLLAVTMAALALSASCSFGQQAAPDPARLAAAKALLDATDFNEQAAKSLEQMKMGLLGELARHQPADAERLTPMFEALMKADNPIVKTYMDDVKTTMIAFYADHFAIDEIEAIKAFQSSPVGRKFQAQLPGLSAAMAGPLVRFQQAMQPEIIRLIQGGGR